MPITSRPDLLPFALPNTIGLPYHGLVKSGKLPTSIGDVDHVQPDDTGDTNLVRHTKSSAVSRGTAGAALDAEKGYAFQDYAILSGRVREIGGQELGRYHWIYCDTEYSWQVSVSYVATSSALTATVWLEKPFGLFGVVPAPTMTRRQLATYSFQFKRYNGANNTAASVSYLHMTHSATGAITAVNVVMNYNANNDYRQTAQISHSFKVVVSGDGNIAKGTVGADVVASCTKLADAPDMVVTSSSSSGDAGAWSAASSWPSEWTGLQLDYFTPNNNCDTGAETGELHAWELRKFLIYPEPEYTSKAGSTTNGRVRSFLYCAQPSGNIINVTETYTTTNTQAGEISGDLVTGVEQTWHFISYLECPSNVVTLTDAYVDPASQFDYAFSGTSTTTEQYKLEFGGYSKTLSHTTTTTNVRSYYVESIVESLETIAAYQLGNTSTSDTTPAKSWLYNAGLTYVQIKTNNLAKFLGNNEHEIISILGNTTISADVYATFDPGKGTIATDATDAICYV